MVVEYRASGDPDPQRTHGKGKLFMYKVILCGCENEGTEEEIVAEQSYYDFIPGSSKSKVLAVVRSSCSVVVQYLCTDNLR